MGKEQRINLGLLSYRAWEDSQGIHLKASCLIRLTGSREPADTGLIRIDTAVMKDIGSVKFKEKYGKKLPKGFRLNSFELVIDRETAESLDIQNRLIVNYDGRIEGRMVYSLTDRHTG